MYTCRICAGQLDSGVACAPCAGQLKADLRSVWGSGDLHGLDTDLDLAIGKQTVFATNRGKPTKAAEAPLPINLAASEARQVLHSTLSTWCRVLLDEIDGPHPADTLASMARWMHLRTEQVRHAEWGDEAIDEIRAAVAQARRAVDRPGDRVYAGPCPQCGQGLYSRPDEEGAVCRAEGCAGAVEDRWARIETEIDRAREVAVTAREAAIAVRAYGRSITERWVNRLVEMGRLAPVEEGSPRRYRLGDIIDVVVDKTGKKAS